MKDVWNKTIKIGAITGICIAAIVALCVLSLFAYMGANTFLTGATPLQKDTSTVIISGNIVENVFSSLGYAFLTLLINVSMFVAFGFVLGVWVVTIFWVLHEDIEYCWMRLKALFKSFLYALIGNK